MPSNRKHPVKKTYPPLLEGSEPTQVQEVDWGILYQTVSTIIGNSPTEPQALGENISDMLHRLESFQQMPNNWDSYGAMAPAPDAIEAGKRFVGQLVLHNQWIDFTAPGPNGEVSVELKFGSKYMEFVFYPAGKWKYTAFENKALFDQGNYDPAELPSLLRWLNN